MFPFQILIDYSIHLDYSYPICIWDQGKSWVRKDYKRICSSKEAKMIIAIKYKSEISNSYITNLAYL